MGEAFRATIEEFLDSQECVHLAGRVNLILTSPPFPLASPKAYGNKTEADYIAWLSQVVFRMRSLLTDDGSLVLEIGNAWKAGSPTMSLATMRTLMSIADGVNYQRRFGEGERPHSLIYYDDAVQKEADV